MTDQELIAAAKQYDATQNEGNDGYNPHWDELARRDAAAAPARIQAEKDEWTLTTTTARRDEFINLCRAGEITDRESAFAACESHGYKLSTLQNYIAKHGLKK